MIKCTRIDEDHVQVELEGEGKDIFSEMCILFSDLRKKRHMIVEKWVPVE